MLDLNLIRFGYRDMGFIFIRSEGKEDRERQFLEYIYYRGEEKGQLVKELMKGLQIYEEENKVLYRNRGF